MKYILLAIALMISSNSYSQEPIPLDKKIGASLGVTIILAASASPVLPLLTVAFFPAYFNDGTNTFKYRHKKRL